MPPTMMNSQPESASAATILSAKCSTLQSLLHKQPPGLMVPQPFGGRHRQSRGGLRPIHVALMTEVEQGRVRLCWRQRGNGCGFHAGILPRTVHPAAEKRSGGAWVLDLRIGATGGPSGCKN